MKRWLAASCAALCLSAFALAQDEQKPEERKLDFEASVMEKASYGIGINIGRTLQRQGLSEIDPKQLAAGIADAYKGGDLRFSEEELQEAVTAFQRELMAKKAEKDKAAKEKNLKDGQAFLAQNKTQEGIKTLPSGLQYKVIEAGDGKSPTKDDTVKTHYRGTLIDGTEFDSSYKRGEPAVFPVSGVIKGWTEALQQMKTGAKWKLFIPADLAYGENPPPGSPIGPNAVLVFDIELLGIE